MNNLINTTITITIGIALLMGVTSAAFATGNAYESGYQHGLDDCKLGYEDKYINGVNKDGESTGRDHHTDKFLDGYDTATSTCAQTIIQNVDTNIRENTQNQAAETNQGASCKILIGNCNVGQSSENAFANKNDN